VDAVCCSALIYFDGSIVGYFLFPVSLLCSFIYIMATLTYGIYIRFSTHKIDTHTVRQRYNALGNISFEEVIITLLLGFTIILWLLREPPGCTDCGWQSMFRPYVSWYGGNKELISDGTVVLFTSFLMFFVPAKNRVVGKRILEWDVVIKKLPWDVLLVLGGGFALSKSFSSTGFTGYIAQHLSVLSSLPHYLVAFLISTIVTFLTEFTSNSAVASVMLPIVAATAVGMRVNPLFLMVPTTISCSFAFCLPVATPSNAMVFGTGQVTVQDLVRSGLLMNAVGIAVNVAWLAIAGPILGIHLHEFPDWAS